ncbi:MAG: PKD domain-containing protein [Bacteroidota bacterium]
MKKIIKLTSLFFLSIMVFTGKAQTITITIGNSAVLTAVNSPSLSSPIYSINPGGLTSANATFVVSPLATTVYTMYVTGTNTNSAVQTTSTLATVIVTTVTQPTVVCMGTSSVVTAMNYLGLSGPSYSLNPGGISSSSATFAISPTITTTYTLYVTGTNSNSAVVTTSILTTVQPGSAPITSVSPLSQTVGCGPGVTGIASCTAILPSTNVTHYWYSPVPSMSTPFPTVPLASGGQISTYPMSVFNGSVTTYTCVVVDNTTGCSSSKTVQIVSNSGFAPNFAVASFSSANQFTLGCGTRSVTDINIVGANTNPPPGGGVVTYTVLPPGYIGSYSTSPMVSTYTTNLPGTYTVIVKDVGNMCESRLLLSVTQNTLTPSIFTSASTRTLSCNIPSVSLQGSSSNPNVNYLWKRNQAPPLITNSILPVSTTTAGASAPSATVIDNYTLTVQDNNNTCITTTIVTMYQNIRPPLAGVALSGITPGPVCQHSMNATNNSTTGVLPGTFYGTAGINSILWQGPFPQPTVTLSSTYVIQTSGSYTTTMMDMNNGCTTTTVYIATLAPRAAFVHTITGAQANFSNASLDTHPNTTYFWDFGDGTFSTSENPQHTYQNGGAHLVKLKIYDPVYWCSDSVIQSINVSGVPCNANSNFSMVPTTVPQVWNVVPAYPWNIVNAEWSWGDGSTSNTLYTAHQYSAAGMYSICLSVTVSCVASSSTCTTYSVYRGSQAALVIAINVVAPALVSGLDANKDKDQFNWNIAPNPNSGEFNLNFSGAPTEKTQVLISDLTGRIVHEQWLETSSVSTTVRTENLPHGLYLVTIKSGDLKLTKRMVVGQ